MKRKQMGLVAELADYDETLYKVEGNRKEEQHGETQVQKKEDNDDDDGTSYLIATAEQPLSAIYSNEVLTEKELPIRFGGFSSCFRKEAGAHGKDTRGIFRIHQFEKVEIFSIVEPEKSPQEHLLMVDLGKQFMTSLGLTFRSIKIVSKALNNAAALK